MTRLGYLLYWTHVLWGKRSRPADSVGNTVLGHQPRVEAQQETGVYRHPFKLRESARESISSFKQDRAGLSLWGSYVEKMSLLFCRLCRPAMGGRCVWVTHACPLQWSPDRNGSRDGPRHRERTPSPLFLIYPQSFFLVLKRFALVFY